MRVPLVLTACLAFGAGLACDVGSASASAIPKRKAAARDLGVQTTRYTLGNGLTVVLAPEPGAAEVAVELLFRAGTLFEPRGQSGLAHLVEHMLFTGTSTGTDYAGLIAARGGRDANAFTSARFMSFYSAHPAEDLPFALWVHAERLRRMPESWTDAELERHRRVVHVERLQRTVDVHFSEVDRYIQSRSYPKPHPLHAGIVGDPAELGSVRLEDVRAFVQARIVPQQAVLVVAGAFEVEEARRWIARTLAGWVRGSDDPPARAVVPTAPSEAVYALKARRSRRPRVTVLWRLPQLNDEIADALTLGAGLIESYIDGAFGTRVYATVDRLPDGGVFRLDLVLPYDKPARSAQQEAEALLRYLTAVDMPRDVFAATRLAIDRHSLFALDSLAGRARALGVIELEYGSASLLARRLQRHWSFHRHDIQHIAWKQLVTGPPRIIVHARPTRPLPPKLDWDDRLGEEESGR